MDGGEPPEITYAAHDLATGRWKNISLAVWRARPTVESAVALQEHYSALAKSFPQGFFSFGAIEAGVPNPDEPARKAISAAMDAVQRELLGAAFVVEDTGFGAAALRATLATMSLLTRSRFPRRFFSSVDDAAAWTARQMPDLGGAGALVSSFAYFRLRI